jgi:pseudouridine-5'-phosphate glycosidase
LYRRGVVRINSASTAEGIGIARAASSQLLTIDPAVAAVVAAGGPVVALESTIITHGMPYPENLAMARAVEDIIRGQGCTPATIAMIDGQLRVGLDPATLAALATRTGVTKASRRDLAPLAVRKATAGTTVAATMAAAALAGIAVFATGGIGGVHRGAADTFDISADLRELATSPVAVVCAGAKSILDIGKTLEYLESLGVPVLGYGTHDFPAFFTRRSGFAVDYRFDSPRELAEVIVAHRALGLGGGMLIANPVPTADALPDDEIESLIAQAVREAHAAGFGGKELTPFLLARINELTGGASLTANIALVKANALLAAAVAVELAQLS